MDVFPVALSAQVSVMATALPMLTGSPLAWRSITAGIVLAFCRALGDFGITLMVAGSIPGKTQTLPLAIYDHVQANEMYQANVLSLVAVVTVVVLLIGVGRFARLRY